MSEKRSTREDVPFTYRASCGMEVYARLAGVRHDLLFYDHDAIVEAYRKGRPLAEELFGPDVAMGGPHWTQNSYGHANTLGCELAFPEDSEVAHTPIHGSLEEGISALKRDVDFTREGMFPFFLDLWEKVKRSFPEEKILFNIKSEGPLTTAWTLRGHDFFLDTKLDPEAMKEYLRLVTESIVKFRNLIRRINGEPEFTAEGQGLVDDLSAMISPADWSELVAPFIERYYAGQTNGPRSAHIEGLTVDHLKYLDQLRLARYDPSVSPQLTPALIRDHCSVPFDWRLNSTHYPQLSVPGVERWVFESVADGASRIFTHVERGMCTAETAEKVRAFIRAARQVEELLAEGFPREKLRERMPAERGDG